MTREIRFAVATVMIILLVVVALVALGNATRGGTTSTVPASASSPP